MRITPPITQRPPLHPWRLTAIGPAGSNLGHTLKTALLWLLTKYMPTAAVVVVVSEVAKRNDKLGGFLAALPLVTFLALIWLCVEKQPMEKIANPAWCTFYYAVPTLPMFLAFPLLLPRLGFWPTMLASVAITVVCFGVFALLVRPFGIQLLP